MGCGRVFVDGMRGEYFRIGCGDYFSRWVEGRYFQMGHRESVMASLKPTLGTSNISLLHFRYFQPQPKKNMVFGMVNCHITLLPSLCPNIRRSCNSHIISYIISNFIPIS